MKILYYIHSLVVGGAEKLVTDYLVMLKKKGMDVILVEAEKQNSFLKKVLEEHAIPIVTLLPAFGGGVCERVKRKLYTNSNRLDMRWDTILQEEQPDIIHIHTGTDFIADIAFPKNQMFYSFHADVDRALSRGTKKNKRCLVKLAEEEMNFIALTKGMARDIKRIYGTENVVCIPNGIDIAYIKQQKYDRKIFLEKLGIPKDAFILGHVARFHPVKNHEKTIEVFSEVAKKNDKAFLILVGTGDEKRIEEITSMITQYNLSDRVRMLGLREDATAIMSVFDAMILPSFSESFSLVLLEAQVHNVRCVASKAIPEDVICNANCFRMDLEESAEKWAELLLANTEHNDVQPICRFDLDIVVEQILEQYNLKCVQCNEQEK